MKFIRVLAISSALVFGHGVTAQAAEAQISAGQVDAIMQALGLKEILRGAIKEQDIDTLNVFIKDTIAGKPAKLPEDLLKRLELAGEKLQIQLGPMLDLVLNIAAEKAKQALRDGLQQ